MVVNSKNRKKERELNLRKKKKKKTVYGVANTHWIGPLFWVRQCIGF